MATIVKTGGGVPVSDYEALQAQLNSLQNSYNSLNSEYNSYKSSHAHSNDDYNNYISVNNLAVTIYKLGRTDSNSTRTFNVSGYANFRKFSARNFFVRPVAVSQVDGGGSANWRNIIASYNNSTGILTCNAIYEYEGYHGRHYFINYDVYLIDPGNVPLKTNW